MAVNRPFRRNVRQFIDGTYAANGRYAMVYHPSYALDPDKYVRSYKVIQNEFEKLLEYIEPSDDNPICYSIRTHELLMRTCIEVEANFKAILLENGYKKSGTMNMSDYQKIEASHRLSSYAVKLPYWSGSRSIRTPFAAWSNSDKKNPTWYSTYNVTKHDRHGQFAQANFSALIDAVGGLAILLASQFLNRSPSSMDFVLLGSYGLRDPFESSIGGFFRVRYPDDFPMDQRYGFEWTDIKDEPDPFQCLSF